MIIYSKAQRSVINFTYANLCIDILRYAIYFYKIDLFSAQKLSILKLLWFFKYHVHGDIFKHGYQC